MDTSSGGNLERQTEEPIYLAADMVHPRGDSGAVTTEAKVSDGEADRGYAS